MHHEPDRSWTTDPDYHKGTQPRSKMQRKLKTRPIITLETDRHFNWFVLQHRLVLHWILRAGSHLDISTSTSINISIRKIRKTCVNRGYIKHKHKHKQSIRKSSIPLCLCLCLCNPGSNIFFLFFLCLCLCLCSCLCQSVNQP